MTVRGGSSARQRGPTRRNTYRRNEVISPESQHKTNSRKTAFEFSGFGYLVIIPLAALDAWPAHSQVAARLPTTYHKVSLMK